MFTRGCSRCLGDADHLSRSGHVRTHQVAQGQRSVFLLQWDSLSEASHHRFSRRFAPLFLGAAFFELFARVSCQEYKDIFQTSHGAKLGFQSPFFLARPTDRSRSQPIAAAWRRISFDLSLPAQGQRLCSEANPGAECLHRQLVGSPTCRNGVFLSFSLPRSAIRPLFH